MEPIYGGIPVMASYPALPYGAYNPMQVYAPQVAPVMAQPGMIPAYSTGLLYDENDDEKPAAKAVNTRRMNSNVQSGIQQFGQGNTNLQGNIQQVGRRSAQVQYQRGL